MRSTECLLVGYVSERIYVFLLAKITESSPRVVLQDIDRGGFMVIVLVCVCGGGGGGGGVGGGGGAVWICFPFRIKYALKLASSILIVYTQLSFKHTKTERSILSETGNDRWNV